MKKLNVFKSQLKCEPNGLSGANAKKSRLVMSRSISAFALTALLSLSLSFGLASQSFATEEEVAWEETDEGKACERDKHNLEVFQKEIFDMKLNDNDDDTLLDLLKERDQLTAKMSVNLTLLRIWNDYQNFLNENSHIAGTEIKNPEGTQELLGTLNKLQSFMSRNQAPVERYHIVSEVLNSVGPENLEKIKQAKTDAEKFEIIKQALIETCSGSNKDLYICSSGADVSSSLHFLKGENVPEPDRNQVTNKFVNVLAELDGGVDWADFSDAFIDNSKDLNPIGDLDFVKNFNGLIERSKEECRKIVLTSSDDVDACLEKSFKDLNLSDSEKLTVTRLQNLNPQGGSIDNISQLVSSYVEVAKNTQALHREEVRNGTVEDLIKLADEVKNWREDFRTAEQNLTSEDTISAYRQQFKNLNKKKFLELGNFLNNGEFHNNLKIFKKYGGGDRPGTLNLTQRNNENNADYANRLLQGVICGRVDADCDASNSEFKAFKMEGDKLVVDENAIIQTFKDMMERAGGFMNLHTTLYHGQESISKKLDEVESKIASLKQSKDYKRKNAFKDFLWRQAANSCQRKVNDQNIVSALTMSPCKLSNRVQTGLNDFLKIGDDLIAYQTRSEVTNNLSQLSIFCQEYFDEDREYYDELLGNGGICSDIYDQHQVETDLQEIKTEAARSAQKRLKNRNTIYEYDSRGKKVDVYRPKSTSAILLPQLAYTFNEQLPFYLVQRPGMKMQVEQWRQAGYAQKTQMAFLDAQRQSFLNNSTCGPFGCYYNTTVLESASPTFGQSAFDFGSSSTLPSTGFGF